jgi:tetratricopeptide (TPR) repeat protein
MSSFLNNARFVLVAGLLLLIAMVGLSGCRSAHTTSAILYIDEQNYDKAVEVIHEGFQFQDDEPDAFYYLGEAYSHLAEEAVEDDDFFGAKKNYELAYDAYMRAVEIDEKNWRKEVRNSLNYNYQTRLRQASRDWDEGYYEQAEGHLRLAYSALPDSLTPVKNIARMKKQMAGETADPDSSRALLSEALELVDQALVKNPEAYLLQVDKANILNELDRNDEARELFATLLAEHPDDTDLMLDIANLASEEGDYSRAGDLYVRVVDIYQDDDDASNDDQNKEMLLIAGSWYSHSSVGRYEDALVVLDRVSEREATPSFRTMILRLKAYYNWGKRIKDAAALETDVAVKAEQEALANEKFARAVEVGNATVGLHPLESEGFLYLSMSQMETGDFTASETNFKTYQQLESGVQ